MRTFLKGVYASLIAAVILSGGAALTGCETSKGVGRDTEKLGEKVQDAAD